MTRRTDVSSKAKTHETAAKGRPGVLYLVATPIGNLDDIGLRALATLRQVDLIAAEDTRHSSVLLARHAIGTPMVSLHEHNEDRMTDQLLDRLLAGSSIALISDAGTPLISDPGLPLVSKARSAGVRVAPIPGACAAIAALSAAGLAVDRFAFEGFLPRTSAQRIRLFESLREESRTLIFYESSHRIWAAVTDLATVFGNARRLVIARELTKVYETIVEVDLDQPDRIFQDQDMLKGEFVLVLEGAKPRTSGVDELTSEQQRVLRLCLQQCSVRTAAKLAADVTGGRRELFYRAALAIHGTQPENTQR